MKKVYQIWSRYTDDNEAALEHLVVNKPIYSSENRAIEVCNKLNEFKNGFTYYVRSFDLDESRFKGE